MPFAVILRKVDHLRDVSTRPTGWVDAELAKKGRFVNVTSIAFGLLIVLVTILLLHLDAQAETRGRRVSITKDVPILRADHISTKSSLLGVWRGQRLKAVSV